MQDHTFAGSSRGTATARTNDRSLLAVCALSIALRARNAMPARRGITAAQADRPTRVYALLILLAVLFGVTLIGCKPRPPAVKPPMSVGIAGYNFTNEGVQVFSVNGNRGSNLLPYGGGGGTSCCVSLPDQWSPALTVRVYWVIGHYTEPWEKRKHMTADQEIACCWVERTLTQTVAVQRYGNEGGDLQVFFLPEDKVEVWVTNYDLGHDKHPSGKAYPKSPVPTEYAPFTKQPTPCPPNTCPQRSRATGR